MISEGINKEAESAKTPDMVTISSFQVAFASPGDYPFFNDVLPILESDRPA